jgi:hypothetical protein
LKNPRKDVLNWDFLRDVDGLLHSPWEELKTGISSAKSDETQAKDWEPRYASIRPQDLAFP